jgi:hypothetical protein
VATSWRSCCRKPEGIEAPSRKSKRTKKTIVGDNSTGPSLCDGRLSGADFDESEWEIIYPRFVEESLVDLIVRTNEVFNVSYECYNTFESYLTINV